MSDLKRIRGLFTGGRKRGNRLLESAKTKIAHIEFTSRCNLQCVFCRASQPGYKGIDIDEETLNGVIGSLKTRKVKVVAVNGHGETTIYENWHRYCNRLLDEGHSLHVISNFAKILTPEEIDTLSRFRSIEISCDTVDPGLFKKLRRGGDLRTLCLNIARLRAAGIKRSGEGHSPTVSFSCVISDQNVLQLMDYVSFALALGVRHFNFCNLTKYPDLAGVLNAGHITDMPPQTLAGVRASLKETFTFLERAGIRYHFQKGLLDSLEQKIRDLKAQPDRGSNTAPENPPRVGGEREAEVPEDAGRNHLQARKYSAPQPGSLTRDCLDPWQFVQVQANRDVLPCCWHQAVGTLDKGRDLSDVLDNFQIKELRRELLTGRLSHECTHCPSKGLTTTAKLRRKVSRYVYTGIKKFLPRWKSTLPPVIPDSREIIYGEGWYPPETDPGIPYPGWRNWRWTAGRAACVLGNPGKVSLLAVKGSVDKSKFEDQKVVFKIGDRLLDSFVPPSAKFFRDYVITPEMMGKGDRFTLCIETDRVFVPCRWDPESKDRRELGLQVYTLFFKEREAI